MTALITAIFGGYDQPKPLPDDHGFDDAVLVTDRPLGAAGWRVVVESSPDHPRMAAKRPKALPWEYTAEPTSVWLDGSMAVLPGGGLRAAADDHLALGDLVAFRHSSGRLDAFEEAEFTATYATYHASAEALREQAEAYRAAGLPVASGLWECGLIARRHTDAVRRFGQAWLHQCQWFTAQDQVSFPMVAWSRGVEVTPWQAGSHWSCGWVTWHPHQ